MLKAKWLSASKIRLGCLLALPAVLYAIPLERITQGGHSICLFKNLLGRECWGCGMTRAIFSLLHFEFQAAWEYNRLVVVVAPLLAYLYIKEIIRTIKRVSDKS